MTKRRACEKKQKYIYVPFCSTTIDRCKMFGVVVLRNYWSDKYKILMCCSVVYPHNARVMRISIYLILFIKSFYIMSKLMNFINIGIVLLLLRLFYVNISSSNDNRSYSELYFIIIIIIYHFSNLKFYWCVTHILSCTIIYSFFFKQFWVFVTHKPTVCYTASYS